MSFCTMPRKPKNNTEKTPKNNTKHNTNTDKTNNNNKRATMKMPAVTMVAAWISAEIGVGPSIESGSQTCNDTCADLPMAQMNSRMQLTVMRFHSSAAKMRIVTSAICGAAAKTSA